MSEAQFQRDRAYEPVSQPRGLTVAGPFALVRPVALDLAARASAVNYLLSEASCCAALAAEGLETPRPIIGYVVRCLRDAGHAVGAAGAGRAAERRAVELFTLMNAGDDSVRPSTAHSAALVAAAALGDEKAFDAAWAEVEQCSDPQRASVAMAAVLNDWVGGIDDYRHEVATAVGRFILEVCSPAAFGSLAAWGRGTLDAVLAAGRGRVPGFPYLPKPAQDALARLAERGGEGVAEQPRPPCPLTVISSIKRGFSAIPERPPRGGKQAPEDYDEAAKHFRRAGAEITAAGWGALLSVDDRHPASPGLDLIAGAGGLYEPDPAPPDPEIAPFDTVRSHLAEGVRRLTFSWCHVLAEVRDATLAYARGWFGMPELARHHDDGYVGYRREQYPEFRPTSPVVVLDGSALSARLARASVVTPDSPECLSPEGAVPNGKDADLDGPVGACGYRIGGVTVQLSGLTRRLVGSLWDDGKNSPGPAREVTDVMEEVYPRESKADQKFDRLVKDLRKRLENSAVPFGIDKRGGRIALVPDVPSAVSPDPAQKLPENSPNSLPVLPDTSPGRPSASA